MPLSPHPAHPPLEATAVAVRLLSLDAHWLVLRWRIVGAGAVAVPPFAGGARTDGLWRTTCFELFVVAEGDAYAEFNLSPSERWAAYDFTAPRVGMAERPVPRAPVATWRGGGRGGGGGRAVALFDAAIARAALPPLPAPIALSAVIEEAGGAKSYWALVHPGATPDFHDPRGFALRLG